MLMIALHYLFPGFKWLDWPWRIAGAVPVLTGVAMAMWADGQFKERGTTVVPFEISSTLVTEGAFAASRNPMYLGLLCLLLALAIFYGTLTALIIVPAFIWYMTEFQIKPEEEALRRIFGADYGSYQKRVRRWI